MYVDISSVNLRHYTKIYLEVERGQGKHHEFPQNCKSVLVRKHPQMQVGNIMQQSVLV